MNSKSLTHKKGTLKRKFIALDDKLKILNRLSSGEKAGLIAKTLGLNENESKIRNSVTVGSSISAKRVVRVRNVLIEKMQKGLILWIEDCGSEKKNANRFKCH